MLGDFGVCVVLRAHNNERSHMTAPVLHNLTNSFISQAALTVFRHAGCGRGAKKGFVTRSNPANAQKCHFDCKTPHSNTEKSSIRPKTIIHDCGNMFEPRRSDRTEFGTLSTKHELIDLPTKNAD